MTRLNAKKCVRKARILFFAGLLTLSYSVTSFADVVSYDFAGLIDSIGTNPVGGATVGTAFSGSFFFDKDFVTSVTLLPPFFGVNNYRHVFDTAGAGLTLDMNGISFRSAGASINLRDDSVPGGDQPFTLNFVLGGGCCGFNVWITSPLHVPDNTVLPTSLPLEGMRLNVCVSGGYTCSHGVVTELTAHVHSATQVYNFDTRFVNGESTPLTNRSPDIGDSLFLASFTSSPVASAFVINGPSSLNSLFSGGALQQLTFSLNTLTIDFNTPVVRVSADFATFASASLSLTTAVGSTTQLSGSVGGFPGGTIHFSSITPFTRIQLSSSTFFAIDNLILDTPVTPTIESVITAVSQAVANGTLRGAGPGNSSEGRIKAWLNMLNAAQRMIESGGVTAACAQLQDVYLRVDGVSPPPDFVTGPSAPALAAMIQALRKGLGCL